MTVLFSASTIQTTKKISITLDEQDLEAAIIAYIKQRAKNTGNADIINMDWDTAKLNISHDISNNCLLSTDVRLTIESATEDLGRYGACMAIATLLLQFEGKDLKVDVSSFQEASVAMRSYIEQHNFGASHMRGKCGDVMLNGKRIGIISYNGRAWTGPYPYNEITGDDFTNAFE